MREKMRGQGIRRPRGTIAAALAVCMGITMTVAGCASTDQARLTGFIGRTVTPGMPMEQALWRLTQEGFTCDERQAAPAIVCSRDQPRLVRSACVEQVELRRRADQTLATVDVAPTLCKYL
jgi:hypothetical protein